MNRFNSGKFLYAFAVCVLISANAHLYATGVAVFNIKDYGASGVKADNATPAIQKAIDACGKAGGGMVYLPPGEYTSERSTCAATCAFTLKAAPRFTLQRI